MIVFCTGSQQAWSFAGTVRENVLFGSIYDEEKYKKVLHVCALEKDIQLFPYGIQQLINFLSQMISLKYLLKYSLNTH